MFDKIMFYPSLAHQNYNVVNLPKNSNEIENWAIYFLKLYL